MNNQTAHNLRIDRMIYILSSYLLEGLEYIDIVVEGPLSLKLKPSKYNYNKGQAQDDDMENIDDLIV